MRTHDNLRVNLATFLTLTVALLSIGPPKASAQLIVPPPVTANVSSITFSDVNIRDATTSKWLFTVSVLSGLSPKVTEATLTVKLSANLADGESFANAIMFTTTPFSVPRVITNLDITNKTGLQVDAKTWFFDETAKNRFKDLALPTGAMPPGRYHFDITATATQVTSQATRGFDIILSNPSSVDLIFPVDGDPAVSPLPLFQWRYDGPAARISVFEKRPQQASLEEAAGGVPQLVSDVIGTSFQYPSGGVRSLEPGKTYVWYVEGLSIVTGGVALPIRSELRSFTVSAQGAQSLQSYLDDLERALDSKYKPVFDQIRSQGLIPTGSIRLNGSVISPMELLEIIREFRMNPDALHAVGLVQ